MRSPAHRIESDTSVECVVRFQVMVTSGLLKNTSVSKPCWSNADETAPFHSSHELSVWTYIRQCDIVRRIAYVNSGAFCSHGGAASASAGSTSDYDLCLPIGLEDH